MHHLYSCALVARSHPVESVLSEAPERHRDAMEAQRGSSSLVRAQGLPSLASESQKQFAHNLGLHMHCTVFAVSSVERGNARARKHRARGWGPDGGRQCCFAMRNVNCPLSERAKARWMMASNSIWTCLTSIVVFNHQCLSRMR